MQMILSSSNLTHPELAEGTERSLPPLSPPPDGGLPRCCSGCERRDAAPRVAAGATCGESFCPAFGSWKPWRFQGSCLSGAWLRVRARACVPEGLLTQVMGRWVGCSVTHLVYPLGCCKLTGFDVRFGRWLTVPSPPHHCQLYLVLTIFHDLRLPPQPSHLPPPPLLCFAEEYLSECFWQVIHIAPISCDLQSYFFFSQGAGKEGG